MIDSGNQAIDSELAAALPKLPRLDLADLETARSSMRSMTADQGPDLNGLTVTERAIPSLARCPDVPVRIYQPHEPAGPVGILDIHGGGFVLGDLETHHLTDIALARRVGAVVVGVDYRLAPETRFPGALEDCYAVLCWFSEHAAELGVDSDRIALSGISAGAGLCASLALLARDRGGPTPAFQFLGSPELDDRLDTPSMHTFTDTPGWRRSDAERSWDAYLGPGVRGTGAVSPYAAPARATDLTGLPPAYVSVAAFDPLRDEGIAYAQALMQARVPVELHLFPGTFHGSGQLAQAAISKRENGERYAVLRAALGLPPGRGI